MTKYNLLFFCFFLLIFGYAKGQKELKYKDIYEDVVSPDKNLAYNVLLSYLNTEPLHVNANFQLGVICTEKALETDPLVNPSETFYYIEAAKKYFSISAFLDDREVRKNRKYYENIIQNPVSGHIELEDVQNELVNRLEKLNEYEQNLNIILGCFELTQHHYNSCIKIYEQLCRTYPSEEDIIINISSKTKDELFHLKNEFTKTIENFKAYREAVKKYPIKSYNQYWTVKPIKKYGFDGFTIASFLKQEVALWDFESWINELLKRAENNLQPVRLQIRQFEKKLNRTIDEVNNDNTITDETALRIPVEIVETLKLYDINPLPVVLFQYKIAHIQFLSSIKEFNQLASSNVSFDTKAQLFSIIIKNMQQMTQNLAALATIAKNENINKYYDFVQSSFARTGDIEKYIDDEKQKNQQLFTQVQENLRQTYLNYRYNVQVKKEISYKNTTISLQSGIPDFDKTENGTYFTTKVLRDENSDFYITGYYKRNSNSIKAFMAKTNDTTEIDWLETINIRAHIQKNFRDCGLLIERTPGKCWLLVNSSVSSSTDLLMFNTLYVTDTLGNEIETLKILAEDIPRSMSLNAATKQIVATYIGKDFHPFKAAAENGIIKNEQLNINSLHREKTWNATIEMSGSVGGIISINNNLLLFCNFVSYTDYYGIQKDSKAITPANRGLTNVFAALFDKSGHLIRTSTAENKNPFFATDVFKINNQLHKGALLIGFKGDIANIAKNDKLKEHELFFALSDAFGNLTYSNMDDLVE